MSNFNDTKQNFLLFFQFIFALLLVYIIANAVSDKQDTKHVQQSYMENSSTNIVRLESYSDNDCIILKYKDKQYTNRYIYVTKVGNNISTSVVDDPDGE